MAERRLVTPEEIEEHRTAHPGWEVVDGKLHRELRFPSFVAAFGFMASVALLAERMNHHPEWRNVYGTVTVDLSTHDLGGIGTDDLALAAAMDGLAAHPPTRPASRAVEDGWQVEPYGHSLRGAELRVWLPAAPPRLLLVAGLHGEEPETTLLARRLVERVDGAAAACAVVLCANPDGIAEGVRQNARGVDLNRNFPARSWHAGDSFTFPPGIAPERRVLANRTNRSSTGGAPASEPESAALVALVDRLGPTLVLDLHTPLEVVLHTPGSPEPPARALAEAAGMSRTGDLDIPAPGALRDWLLDTGRGSITYEVEHAGLPALCARHLPGLERLVRGELA